MEREGEITQGPLPSPTDLDSIQQRVGTYNGWSGRINKDILAKAGFVFTGSGDKVVCPSCGLKLLNWTSTDDPLHEHAKRRQLCPFINSTYRQLRLNKPPKHPQYQELQARLDSFVCWPGRFVPKTPEELSAAGFFYIGSADRVTCFQCGITLRDWEEEHDPAREHRRYSEHCQFINNTDLNQLRVRTRTPTSDSGENTGARASASDDRNTKTVQETDGTAIGACGDESPKDQTRTASTISVVEDRKFKDRNCNDNGHENSTCQNTEIKSDENSSNARQSASQKLADENKRLRARRTCKLCQKESVNTLFLPCGHLVTCSSCAPEVANCITCGKPILGTVKTYLV